MWEGEEVAGVPLGKRDIPSDSGTLILIIHISVYAAQADCPQWHLKRVSKRIESMNPSVQKTSISPY